MGVFRIEDADRPHLLRLLIIWVVLSIVGILAALQLPYRRYDQSVQGQDQSRPLAPLTIIALPVFIGVVIMVLYSAIYFRRTTTELIDGPPMLGNTPVQIAWIAISAVLVLFLAVFGIVTLASSNVAQAVGTPGRSIGQSGGQTGSSTSGGTGSELQVQVVAQQWYFTYRYADCGAVETTHL